jgi:CRISPR system Cascade subunit CasD
MQRFLVLRLEAPLAAFGGETIDNYGVIRPFPAKSMITGLLGNALGFERQESGMLQALQDALIVGSRIDSYLTPLREFQTAELSKGDLGWTTWGWVEGRGGGSGSYVSPHLRYRDYWTDVNVTVVISLTPVAPVAIDKLVSALQEPARPLFLGRKCCIPSGPILNGDISAKSILGALLGLDLDRDCTSLQWPAFDGFDDDDALLGDHPDICVEPVCDERNWITGVHGGLRFVRVLRFKGSNGKQP